MSNKLLRRTTMTALCIASTAAASPPWTPARVRSEISRVGAESVVDQLAAEGLWDLVENRIAKGDEAWIALAPRLAPGTDADSAEGLGIALAYALPQTPKAVLLALDLNGGPVIGPDRVCGLPFIEVSNEFLRRYKAKAITAVSRIRSQPLAKARRACLAELRR